MCFACHVVAPVQINTKNSNSPFTFKGSIPLRIGICRNRKLATEYFGPQFPVLFFSMLGRMIQNTTKWSDKSTAKTLAMVIRAMTD